MLLLGPGMHNTRQAGWPSDDRSRHLGKRSSAVPSGIVRPGGVLDSRSHIPPSQVQPGTRSAATTSDCLAKRWVSGCQAASLQLDLTAPLGRVSDLLLPACPLLLAVRPFRSSCFPQPPTLSAPRLRCVDSNEADSRKKRRKKVTLGGGPSLSILTIPEREKSSRPSFVQPQPRDSC